MTNALKKNLEVPTSGSQFERDYKSLKSDITSKFEYVTSIPPASILKIFKSNLETDILIDIVKVCNQIDNTLFK